MAPAGRSLTSQPVGPIHTPMMREDASLLFVLARAQIRVFQVASITPSDVEEDLSMAVDHDHARLGQGTTPASHEAGPPVCGRKGAYLLPQDR